MHFKIVKSFVLRIATLLFFLSINFEILAQCYIISLDDLSVVDVGSDMHFTWFMLAMPSSLSAVNIFIFFLFIIFISFWYRTNLKLSKQYNQQLFEAIELNQNTLAREIHDNLAQKMMLIARRAKSIGNSDLSLLAEDCLHDIRNLSYDLHGKKVLSSGLETAIKDLMHHIDSNSSIFIDCNIIDVDQIINKNHKIHVYRIIQESFNNILKHSKATNASLSIVLKRNQALISIQDNGVGFDFFKVKKNNSLGLVSIQERCKCIDASLKIESIRLKGTSLLIQI